MPKVAFLFPGQGAQTVGMAGELCRSLPAARALFDRAADLLGYDLLTVCTTGPTDRLDATDVSQPAIYVASLAALASLEQSEPGASAECVATAGLSLGEYTALTFAGALQFEDGLRLVRQRGEAMQAAADARAGGMVSILLLDQPQVEAIVAQASGLGLVRIANYLCPGNLVVSGDKAACDEAQRLADLAGARTIPLPVAGAFHTPLMQPAVDALRTDLVEEAFRAPAAPVVSNGDGLAYSDTDEWRERSAVHVGAPVRWRLVQPTLVELGATRVLEVGHGAMLAALAKRTIPGVPVIGIANPDDLDRIDA